MNSWIKWSAVSAICCLAGSAVAADHADGPAVAGSASADIADVYAWAPSSTDNLVLIQTIVGDFSENVLYTFHVGRDAAPAVATVPGSWTDIICQFDASMNVSCWAGTGDYVTGDAAPDAGITSDLGTLKVHTGTHADPFYFYLTGFTNTVEAVKAAAPSLTFDAAGCPAVDGPTSATLVGLLTGNGAPENNFAANNISAIVIEVNKDLIAGSGEQFAVYASTHTPGS